jgi:GH15 family glucan-1,4-alpha-glucosidase
VPRIEYPEISDYGFVADCHAVALVSRRGSIDWCCLPRVDSDTCFGRLLDWRRGGYFSIAPEDGSSAVSRRYLDGSLVLETRFATAAGEVRLLDCFAMRPGGREAPFRQLLRVVEGIRGTVRMAIEIVARFDYGLCRPWARRHGERLSTLIGGDDGLVISSDIPLDAADGDLGASFELSAGERRRLSLVYELPHRLYPGEPREAGAEEIDQRLEQTLEWWRGWTGKITLPAATREPLERSAVVLKGLTHAPTGAIVAAATTSLPERIGGERNWDYRYTWVRDSSFAVRSLAEIGLAAEATGFQNFMERTTAGGANQVQVLYGVGGERRLYEVELDWLDGYRGSRPVRVGNAAHDQLQLDVYGELLDVAWRSALQGRLPDDAYWRFLAALADEVVRRWREPDSGIWEMRSAPRHFVHSKAMCWAALDRALDLARRSGREPGASWQSERDAIRARVENEGYDRERGIFVQAFGGSELDAALLQLPRVGFVADDDPRMRRTVAAIREELVADGLVRRYRGEDGLAGGEGTFLACTFWLAECLARQGDVEAATASFERAAATANDLGLFAEEFDPGEGRMLGNFPQALSHYSHLTAALALAEARAARPGDDPAS